MKLPATLLTLLCLTATLAIPMATAAEDNAPAAEEEQAPRKINLTPNKRTTVFEGPLREDGTIDYIAALNEHFNEGVTKENNAFRALYLLMNHEEEPAEGHAARVQAMGIGEAEIASAPIFITLDEYEAQRGVNWEFRNDGESHAYVGDFESPESGFIVEWLQANTNTFDQIIAATKMERWWYPMVEHPHLPGTGIPAYVNRMRDLTAFTWALRYRFMWAAATGQSDLAIDSLLAMQRLAYQVSRGHTLVDMLVAMRISEHALDALETVLALNQMDGKQLRQLAEAWNQRPSLVQIGEVLGFTERAITVQGFMLVPWKSIPFSETQFDFGDSSELDIALRDIGIDYNAGVAMVSDPILAMSELMQVQTYAMFLKRLEAHEVLRPSRWEQVLEHYVGENEDGDTGIILSKDGMDRAGLTEAYAHIFLGRLLPALNISARSWFIHHSREELSVLAIAVARYRADRGQYPDSLDALIPAYLDAIPTDPMDGKPLRFRTGEQVVVYSVGNDLQDDGGIEDYPDGDEVWSLLSADE